MPQSPQGLLSNITELNGQLQKALARQDEEMAKLRAENVRLRSQVMESIYAGSPKTRRSSGLASSSTSNPDEDHIDIDEAVAQTISKPQEPTRSSQKLGFNASASSRLSHLASLNSVLEIPEALAAYFGSATGDRPIPSNKDVKNALDAKMHTAWDELYHEKQGEVGLHGIGIFEAILRPNHKMVKTKTRGSLVKSLQTPAGAPPKLALGFSVLWKILGSMFIVIDVLLIPFKASLSVNTVRGTPSFYLLILSSMYWTINCLVSLSPSFDPMETSATSWQTRLRKTKKYLRSFFILDISLITLDYTFLAVSASPSLSANSAWTVLRTLCLIRVVRLKVIYDVEKSLEDRMAFRGHEWFIHVMTIVKAGCALAVAGHLLGCFWVWLGRIWPDPERTWLNEIIHTDTQGELYGASVHFVLGYLTGAPVDCIRPLNHAERIFTFFLMLCSLLVLGSGVAQVQITLSELTKTSSAEAGTRRTLQVYLNRIRAPMEMSVRLVTFAMNAYKRTHSTVLGSAMSELLSSRLISEIKVLQRQDDLRTHPFFKLVEDMHRDEFILICNAISLHRHQELETLFEANDPARASFYTAYGKFMMTSLVEDADVVEISRPVWLCEISLFMRYSHTSTLISVTFAETLQLTMDDLIGCVRNSPSAIATIYAYGKRYLSMWFVDGPDHRGSVDAFGHIAEIEDQVPLSWAEATCSKVMYQFLGRGLGGPVSSEEPKERLSIPEPQCMEEFKTKFLSDSAADEDPEQDEDPQELENMYTNEGILKAYKELDDTCGFYALAVQPEESKRALCAMLNIVWLYKDRYDLFTTGQAGQNRLTQEQWAELRATMAQSGVGPDEVCALLVFLAIRGIGKVKTVVNLLPETHRTPEKAVMYIIEKAPQLVPSFSQLPQDMQELVKSAFIVHEKFNFGQMLQAENLPSHVYDLQTHVEQYGQGVLKFYLLSTLGVFSGILGPKQVNGSLFLNRANAAKVIRVIQCLQHLSTSTPASIYWTNIMGYAEALGLAFETTEDMLVARLSCLLRAASLQECKVIQSTWSQLNNRDKATLKEVFLADGIRVHAFLFAFLPLYFDNAQKNPCIGFKRALLLLIDLVEVLIAGNPREHLTVRVDLSELALYAKTAEDAITFDLFMERVSVEFKGNETHFAVRKRGAHGNVDSKLDLVARSVRCLSREMQYISGTPASTFEL